METAVVLPDITLARVAGVRGSVAITPAELLKYIKVYERYGMQTQFNFSQAQTANNLIEFKPRRPPPLPAVSMARRLWGVEHQRSLAEFQAAIHWRIENAVMKYKGRGNLPMPHTIGTIVFKEAWERLRHTPPPIPYSPVWIAQLPDLTSIAVPELSGLQ